MQGNRSIGKGVPNAKSIHGQFHVLMAMSARLEKVRLDIKRSDEIYAGFRNAVYTKDREILEKEIFILIFIGEFMRVKQTPRFNNLKKLLFL